LLRSKLRQSCDDWSSRLGRLHGDACLKQLVMEHVHQDGMDSLQAGLLGVQRGSVVDVESESGHLFIDDLQEGGDVGLFLTHDWSSFGW
jgi:hypothetical protein